MRSLDPACDLMDPEQGQAAGRALGYPLSGASLVRESVEPLVLGEEDEVVPPRRLDPPFRHELRHVLHDQAAELLHHHLFILARLQTLLDIQIGRSLSRLSAIDGFIALGYARRADYVREHVGIGSRWAQKLSRLAQAMDRLPLLRRALAAGELTTSKALALLPALDTGNEAAWIAFASEATVRVITHAVRSDSTPPRVEGSSLNGLPGAAVTAACTPEGAKLAGPNAAHEEEEHDEHGARSLVELSVRAPIAVADLLDHTLDIARRAVGTNAPRRELFQFILAEGAAGLELVDGTEEEARNGTGEEIEDGALDGALPEELPAWVGATAPLDPLACRARRDALEAMLERCSRLWHYVQDPDLRVALDPELDAPVDARDPEALHVHLLRLVALRQRRNLDMGELLSTFTWIGLPRRLQFGSRPPYAKDSPIRPGHELWERAQASAHMCSPRFRTIRLQVLPETAALWNRIVRSLPRPSNRPPPVEWQCLLAVLGDFLSIWDCFEPKTFAEKALERDGGCCTVPGCTSRTGQGHHIVPRDHTDCTDDPSNATFVCASHHLRGIHGGFITCRGDGNGALEWTLGNRLFRGDVKIGTHLTPADAAGGRSGMCEALEGRVRKREARVPWPG